MVQELLATDEKLEKEENSPIINFYNAYYQKDSDFGRVS